MILVRIGELAPPDLCGDLLAAWIEGNVGTLIAHVSGIAPAGPRGPVATIATQQDPDVTPIARERPSRSRTPLKGHKR